MDIDRLSDDTIGRFALGILIALETYDCIDGQAIPTFGLADDRVTRKQQIMAIRADLRDLLKEKV